MLRQGSIVRARVCDPQGRNPKVRPLIVLTPNAELDSKQLIAVVAITSKFANPPLDDEIPLPFDPRTTCLHTTAQACVAKCSWREEINIADVIETKGFVSRKLLAEILAKVIDLSGPVW